MSNDQEYPIMVSIICNTFNHENFIAQAIEGFLMQRCDFKYEILIHDDASTDNTPEIIRSYEKLYPYLIKAIYQKENQWSKGNKPFFINTKRANGKYIATCEGDDYWTDSKKLQIQIDYLESHPEVVFCAHEVKVVDKYNNLLFDRLFGIQEDRYFIPQDIVMGGAHFPTLSIVSKNISIHDFPTSANKVFNGDIFTISFRANYGNAFLLNKTMGVYRYHDKGIWASLSQYSRSINKFNTVIEIAKIVNNDLKIFAYIRLLASCFTSKTTLKIKLFYAAIAIKGIIKNFYFSAFYHIFRRAYSEIRSKNLSINVQKYQSYHFDNKQ